MLYINTRDTREKVTFSTALQNGLASGGGLYVPIKFPKFNLNDFKDLKSFSEVAYQVLSAFLAGDVLAENLDTICASAFNFPVTLTEVEKDVQVLELFHGPTCAFKDFGARFLAECLCYTRGLNKNETHILVATSGDTGGAVASAFYKKSGLKVGLLFPNGQVSRRQEAQLTCWGENIHSFRVNGTFDDCQNIVKNTFEKIKSMGHNLTSANSINIARLLPQMTYYAYASLKIFNLLKKPVSFIIPSGNLGNAVAAFYAKKCGFPISQLTLATNANATIANYYLNGEWAPRRSISTLANAMDVGSPSNMERLLHLYRNSLDKLQEDSNTELATDENIRSSILWAKKNWNQIICPHTATAVNAWLKHKNRDNDPTVLVATAHPAKFETIIEPLINQDIEIPPVLNDLLSKDRIYTEIEAEHDVFIKTYLNF